jgi:hypothetical protein
LIPSANPKTIKKSTKKQKEAIKKDKKKITILSYNNSPLCSR